MILQGQNTITGSFFEKTVHSMCLGRIELPILPLKRQFYRTSKAYLGERSELLPLKDSYGWHDSARFLARVRTIDKSKVAFKITDVTANFIGKTQFIYGQVESCGIAPNLRSILRTEHREKLCFMPRVVLNPSDDVTGGYDIAELITFDLVDYQDDETIDRRHPDYRHARLR